MSTENEGPLVAFAQEVVALIPDLKPILARAKTGEITPQQALEEMAKIVAATNAEQQLREAARNQLAPEVPDGDPGVLGEGLFQTDVGLPKLNPLYEGALIERTQFDGDIPEFRTGPLPVGVKPAVPVSTDARNPVALGAMLKEASRVVAEKVDAHETKRLQGIEAIAATAPDLSRIREHAELVALESDALAVEVWGSDKTDHPDYRRGHLPAPVQVPTPTGSALAAFTSQERKEQAYHFLSTTQGRRTATAVITEMLIEGLAQHGVTVAEHGEPSMPSFSYATTQIVAADKWTVSLSGPGSTQSSFSFVDTAGTALVKGLVRALDEAEGFDKAWPLRLEVTPVNMVDVRSVGWAARLLSPDGKSVRRLPRGMMGDRTLCIDDYMHFDKEEPS